MLYEAEFKAFLIPCEGVMILFRAKEPTISKDKKNRDLIQSLCFFSNRCCLKNKKARCLIDHPSETFYSGIKLNEYSVCVYWLTT